MRRVRNRQVIKDRAFTPTTVNAKVWRREKMAIQNAKRIAKRKVIRDAAKADKANVKIGRKDVDMDESED
jgi:hypothetical protein